MGQKTSATRTYYQKKPGKGQKLPFPCNTEGLKQSCKGCTVPDTKLAIYGNDTIVAKCNENHWYSHECIVENGLLDGPGYQCRGCKQNFKRNTEYNICQPPNLITN